jgi:hypothetical protein
MITQCLVSMNNKSHLSIYDCDQDWKHLWEKAVLLNSITVSSMINLDISFNNSSSSAVVVKQLLPEPL